MAIDKRKAAPWLKAVIVAFVVMLVIGLSSSFIPGLATLFETSPGSQAGTAGTLDAIAARHAPGVAAMEQVLAGEPTSHTVLVSLGNGYFDWAREVQAAAGVPQGSDRPYWTTSISFYERALASFAGTGAPDPAVGTDLAIAYAFAGRMDEAIAQARAVNTTSPDFAPAFYHLGRFLEFTGDAAGAIVALDRYLALDPQGTTPGGDPEDARSILARLKEPGRTAPATPTP